MNTMNLLASFGLLLLISFVHSQRKWTKIPVKSFQLNISVRNDKFKHSAWDSAALAASAAVWAWWPLWAASAASACHSTWCSSLSVQSRACTTSTTIGSLTTSTRYVAKCTTSHRSSSTECRSGSRSQRTTFLWDVSPTTTARIPSWTTVETDDETTTTTDSAATDSATTNAEEETTWTNFKS